MSHTFNLTLRPLLSLCA